MVNNIGFFSNFIIRTLAKSMQEGAYGTGVASNWPQT
uniref:Uncharacterized protein n=1 Tax=viral metagenome TaxID=1070528 RepID=A0A6C0H6U6_9ZZZZ